MISELTLRLNMYNHRLNPKHLYTRSTVPYSTFQPIANLYSQKKQLSRGMSIRPNSTYPAVVSIMSAHKRLPKLLI